MELRIGQLFERDFNFTAALHALEKSSILEFENFLPGAGSDAVFVCSTLGQPPLVEIRATPKVPDDFHGYGDQGEIGLFIPRFYKGGGVRVVLSPPNKISFISAEFEGAKLISGIVLEDSEGKERAIVCSAFPCTLTLVKNGEAWLPARYEMDDWHDYKKVSVDEVLKL